MQRNPPRLPLDPSLESRLIRQWTGGGKGKQKTLRFFDPDTGTTYSRRQVEQSFSLGGVTFEETALRHKVQQIRNFETRRPMAYDERFGTLLARYVKAQGITKKEATRTGSIFWERLRDLTRSGTSPETRKARALVEFGLRKPNWRQPVGMSPEPAPVQLTRFEQAHIAATYTPAPAPFTSEGERAPVYTSSRRASKKKKGRAHPRRSR